MNKCAKILLKKFANDALNVEDDTKTMDTSKSGGCALQVFRRGGEIR